MCTGSPSRAACRGRTGGSRRSTWEEGQASAKRLARSAINSLVVVHIVVQRADAGHVRGRMWAEHREAAVWRAQVSRGCAKLQPPHERPQTGVGGSAYDGAQAARCRRRPRGTTEQYAHVLPPPLAAPPPSDAHNGSEHGASHMPVSHMPVYTASSSARGCVRRGNKTRQQDSSARYLARRALMGPHDMALSCVDGARAQPRDDVRLGLWRRRARDKLSDILRFSVASARRGGGQARKCVHCSEECHCVFTA